MQQLTKFLLLTVLLGFSSGSSLAQKSRGKTRKPSRPPVICEISSVPKGTVVVGYKPHSACRDGAELLVRHPENGDIICAESPVPPGFSITSEAQGSLVGTCPTKAFLITGASPDPAEGPPAIGRRGPATERRSSARTDDAIARAFASGLSDIQVEGEGTVIRLLPDDLNGSRHQRFIVELASGQTLLISHNIDLAPRINTLAEGDTIRFNGEYIWNAKGGLIHWTHHDPRGRHVAGWLIHNGKTYQ
jgi:hypothetical protein